MSALTYNETVPENNKDNYEEYDVLDMMITGQENEDLVANSVRFCADLLVEQPSGTRVATSIDVFFDPRVGAHAFIENINVSSALGNHQTILEYPRMVAMLESATKNPGDLNNAEDVVELKSAKDEISKSFCEGNPSENTGTTIITDQDFSLKPVCILNNMVGNLPFKKVGYVKLSISLNRVMSALYTNVPSATQKMKYVLSNCKLTYNTTPTQGGVCQMRSVVSLKSSIESSFSNVASKVPAVCDAVSVNFLEQGFENNPAENGQRLSRLPNVEEITFLFNDNLNQYVSYPLTDQGAIQEAFINSLSPSGHNQVNANYWKANNGYGIGLNWLKPVNLSNQKFNIQIKCGANGVSATKPYIMYSHFWTTVVI